MASIDSIIRGTTPTISITIPGLAQVNPNEVWLSFRSKEKIITFQYSETDDLGIDGDTIIINLSQAQTLEFYEGLLEMQVRLLDVMGMAYATPIMMIMVDPVIQEGVIELITVEEEGE